MMRTIKIELEAEIDGDATNAQIAEALESLLHTALLGVHGTLGSFTIGEPIDEDDPEFMGIVKGLLDEMKTPDMDIDEDDDEKSRDPDDGPEDDDLVTSDYRKFFRVGFGHKGPVVVVPESPDGCPDSDWTGLVKAYMDKDKFWPNVWYQGERGDIHLLNMSTGTWAKG